MTQAFNDMLYLFSCAISATDADCDREYDFETIFSLSKAQQIYTILYPVIDKIKEKNNLSVSDELYNEWSKAFYSTIMFSSKRSYYISGLFKKFDEEGIRSCVLKGESLSVLYPVPESRISSDIDLWIPDAEHMEKAIELLRADNFKIGKITADSHQIECHHKAYGLIELHTDICDDLAKQVWFENSVFISDAFVEMEDSYGGTFAALSVTDGAVYVAFHFIKHFLSHGCGCRQLMDMLLYFKKYDKDIEWDKFNLLFDKLRYLKFIHQCMEIGNYYFGMNFKTDVQINTTIFDGILSDMERGGIFGQDEEFRKRFTTYYTNRRKSNSTHTKAQFRYLIRRIKSFAEARHYNLVSIIRDLLKKNKKSYKESDEINGRLTLFESLGFFDEQRR